MQRRKLVMVIFEEGIRPDVMEVLETLGIKHYTLQRGVEGNGVTGPKHGNPIWPGLNDILWLVLEEGQVQLLVHRLHQLRDSLPIIPGLRFIITDCMFV